MQQQSAKRAYDVIVKFPASGAKRTVVVKAVSLEAAEKRALKFHPSAVIHREA